MDEPPAELEKILEASLHDIARGDEPALQECLSDRCYMDPSSYKKFFERAGLFFKQ